MFLRTSLINELIQLRIVDFAVAALHVTVLGQLDQFMAICSRFSRFPSFQIQYTNALS